MCSVQSDHTPCTTKIRILLRTCQLPKTKTVPCDWSRLQTDTEVKRRCTIDVKNKFQALQSNEEENWANTIYNIIQAHRVSAELHVPHKPRNKKSQWEGKEVVEKRGALQDVLKGTSEEVRPKGSKAEDEKYFDRAYAEELEDTNY